MDDPEGGVRYLPGLLDDATAGRWFASLRDGVAWQARQRPMYERIVDVPRLVAAHRLDEPDLPPPLAEAAAMVVDVVGAPFNSVGLNYYRDGRDSVAPHHDKLPGLVPGQPIALLSLGSVRRMVLRCLRPRRTPVDIDLEPGSLLVMSHASQRYSEHGVPKVTGTVGPRISLAFRVRPPASGA